MNPTAKAGGLSLDHHAAHEFSETIGRLNRDYVHHIIDHAYEYVRGHVHTNNIECFWSVFKRTIRGTYIAPRPQRGERP